MTDVGENDRACYLPLGAREGRRDRGLRTAHLNVGLPLFFGFYIGKLVFRQRCDRRHPTFEERKKKRKNS